MKLVMFDIDGTLTQSAETDETCFVQALRDVFGFDSINTDWESYPRCSDSGILEDLFQQRLRRSPQAAEISTFQSHFLSLLAAATASQPFMPITGVRDFVCSLISGSEFAVSLASGAWECSARFKLVSAGLDFHHIPAVFSDSAYTREDIMRLSLTKAAQFHSQDSFDSVTYVGDGVWDARAARSLNYRFIGIAREPVRVARLYAEGASKVFRDYFDADPFIATLVETNHNA